MIEDSSKVFDELHSKIQTMITDLSPEEYLEICVSVMAIAIFRSRKVSKEYSIEVFEPFSDYVTKQMVELRKASV